MPTKRRIVSLILLLAGLTAAPALSRPDEPAAPQPPRPPGSMGRLEGRCPVAGTGEPVAGAVVQVLADGLPEQLRYLEARSGPDGRYSLEVPIGHCRLWRDFSPPGYYIQEPGQDWSVLTSPAEPRVRRDFVFQPGMPWRVEVAGATARPVRPVVFTAALKELDEGFHSTGRSRSR
jgi:hypothetical protein